MSNPARILVQRVLADLIIETVPWDRRDPARVLADFLNDHAEHNGGFLQTFETRISLAFSDPADDMPETCGTWHTRTRETLEEIAAHHYGAAGSDAVRDVLEALARR